MAKFNLQNLIRSRLPCLQWMPHYTKEDLQSDLIAGFTVGLTVIPQSLAYADLAGLPVQYGLYSSFMGSFLYTFLGTSKDITLGPTAIMALLISEYCNNSYGDSTSASDPIMAALLCFFTAIILFAMAIFNVGFLVNFIPHCVIVGFCCSAAILIASSQVKNLLGLSAKIPKPFFDQWKQIFKNLGTYNTNDIIMGVIALIVLKGLQIAKQKYCDEDEKDSPTKKTLKKILWFSSTARNAIVVIVATIIAYSCSIQQPDPLSDVEGATKLNMKKPLKLTGDLKEGLPPLGIPPFSRQVPGFDVTTGEKVVDSDGEICYPYCNTPHHLDKLLIMECPADFQGVSEARHFFIENPQNDTLDYVEDQAQQIIEETNQETEEILTRRRRFTMIGQQINNREKRSSDESSSHSNEIHSADKCGPSYDNPTTVKLGDLLGKIGTGLVIIPIMAYLESVAIAKGFSKKFGYKVDATQELYAISICCFATSLVQGFPVTGSFSRSAVNAASNVKTPAGGIVTGFMVVLSSLFLTPIFVYVPKSALSAVIFLAAISMFDEDGVKHVWTLRKIDILPLLVTFFLCFYEVAIGIGAGVLVALIMMLYTHARPQVKIDKFADSGLIVRIDRNLDYPACDYVETKIMEHRFGTQQFLIIDLSKFTGLDSGAAEQMHTLTSLKNIQTQEKLAVYFCSVSENIKKVLIKAHVNEENIFEDDWKQVLIDKKYVDTQKYPSMQDLTKMELTEFDDRTRPSFRATEAYSDLVGHICEREVPPRSSRGNSYSQERERSKKLLEDGTEDVALHLGY